MKAIRVETPGRLAIVELQAPRISRDDEVLVKVRMAGICGSDVHIQNGTSPVATYPRVIGHEFAGEVVEVGAGVSTLRPGDHVAVDPVISCGKCYPCLSGRSNVCFDLKVRGAHVDGGFQEYVVVPAAVAHRLAKDMAWESAALVEPFTIAAQVVARGAAAPGERVFVAGAGPIGLCILQALRRVGASVAISDILPARLELAARMGADLAIDASKDSVGDRVLAFSEGRGVQLAIDTVCTPRSTQEAVELACNAGRVVLLGFDPAPMGVSQLSIVRKELDVRGSRLNARRFPEVIGWFERGEVDPSLLVSGTYPYSEAAAAFTRIKDDPRSCIKILLAFD